MADEVVKLNWDEQDFEETDWSSESERGWFATFWFCGWFGEDRSI